MMLVFLGFLAMSCSAEMSNDTEEESFMMLVLITLHVLGVCLIVIGLIW